jgi:hypothetical protein
VISLNLGKALELAEQSMEAFQKKLKEIRLKELYELTDNLRFVNNKPAFNAACDVLNQKLSKWYEFMKSSEKKHKSEDFKNVSLSFTWERYESYKLTGFGVFDLDSPELDLDVLPSDFFKSLIDKVFSWKK